jgi:DNA helicase II / ATP-dependent DNA helicase PcrA
MHGTLDSSQMAFCSADPANLRLLAPAGCGKTLSLLYRCAFLAEAAKPQGLRFLIVTFTVAAKQELLSRVSSDFRFASIRDSVDITTLNSWGFRRIRGIAFSPKLISSKEDYHFAMLNQLQPIWRNHTKVRSAIEQRRSTTPQKLMNLMDGFKSLGFDHIRHTNQDIFADHLAALRSDGLGSKVDELLEELAKLGVLSVVSDRQGEDRAKTGDRDIYNSFFRFWRDAAQHMIDSATFTLEDQKYVAYLDERQKLEEGKHLSGVTRYDHVLVDEFQDVNPLDLALVKAIAKRNRATIVVAGDDDQAIFEWRGATPEYILDPARFFGEDFSTYALAVNYRSPRNIVEYSQRLIGHNQRRVDKHVSAARSEEAQIEVLTTEGLVEAMDAVCAEVEMAMGKGGSPSQVALISRKRAQIIPYQIYFASKNIPFCAAEDLQVFMSGAFDRLLRLIMIKDRCKETRIRTQVVDDVLELCGLVKRFPLNKKDKGDLRRHLQQSGVSSVLEAIDALISYRGTLKGANSAGKVSIAMADVIRRFLDASSVSSSLTYLGEDFQGLQIDLGKAEDDIFYTDPPFLQLSEYATRYGDDYVAFVNDIENAKEQLAYIPPFLDDAKPNPADELWKRPLHLMTALRAKGKEFDVVVLLDVNDGVWPSKNARTPEEKEAERRLFYVAFTRAKKRIICMVSKKFGNHEAIPSPFLSELGLGDM